MAAMVRIVINSARSPQELFEKLFSTYGNKSDRSFIYLKSFHRVRVTFNKEEDAKEAKKDLHGHVFLGYELGVFLVQVINLCISILLFQLAMSNHLRIKISSSSFE